MISETADIFPRLNFEKLGCQAPISISFFRKNSLGLRGNTALILVRTETSGPGLGPLGIGIV